MKTRPAIVAYAVSSAFTAICLLSGCFTRGKAKEARVSFGIVPLFHVEKEVIAGSVSEAGIVKEGEGKTKVQILNFNYESSAKELELAFKKEPKP